MYVNLGVQLLVSDWLSHLGSAPPPNRVPTIARPSQLLRFPIGVARFLLRWPITEQYLEDCGYKKIGRDFSGAVSLCFCYDYVSTLLRHPFLK